nr:malectin domain-containing carbohydrate-binding protein [Salinirubrum litoreum]
MVTSVLGPVGVASAQTQAVSFTQTVQSGDTTVAPGETFTVEATVNAADDVNGPAIDVDLPSGWTVTSQESPDGVTYKPSETQWVSLGGSYTITYTVQVPSDAAGGDYTVAGEGSGIDSESTRVTDTDDLTITVEAQNTAPTADAGADQTVQAGDTVTLDATGSSDADGSIASYSWTQTGGTSVSLSDASAAQPTFTAPDLTSEETLTFEVQVTDDDGATATDSVSVTVQPTSTGAKSAEVAITPNSGLEASTYGGGSFQVTNTGDQNIESVTIDLSTTTLPDMVFDPDGTAGDQAAKGLTIDSQSGDGVGVVSTADGDVFSQPHNGQDGSDGYDVLTIEFTDFDPGETVAFSADNDPTSIKGATVSSQEAGPVSGLELARATVDVGYADGTTQTTQAIGDGSQGGAQAVADSDVPAAPSIGAEGVSLDGTALDGYHGAATVTEAAQTITVSGPANADVTLVRVEGELELSNVPDYDGTPGYEIEDFEANKAENVEYYSATLDSNGEATIPVTLTDSTDVGGLNYFVAAVEDGDGAGLSSNVVVLELDPDAGNSAPTVDSITDQGVTEGESLSVDVPASDADGDDLTYSASGPSFVMANADGTLTIAPGADAVGTYTVTVTADDGQATASEEFAVYVDEPDQDGEVVFAANAGGSSYTAADGTTYQAGADATALASGSTYSVSQSIANTEDDTLYQTERYGGSDGNVAPNLALDVEDGTYEVTLKFAEIYQGVSGSDSPDSTTPPVDGTNENDRLFTVTVEGEEVLTEYDIFSEVGPLTATDKTYTVEVTDGTLNVDFAAINDNAKLSAVKVEQIDTADDGPGVIGDFENAPTDPDGDGLYEDVNGDGDVNVGDAQAIFANADDPVVVNNVDAFDYNGDGDVNVGDAQALFANGVEAGDSDGTEA